MSHKIKAIAISEVHRKNGVKHVANGIVGRNKTKGAMSKFRPTIPLRMSLELRKRQLA